MWSVTHETQHNSVKQAVFQHPAGNIEQFPAEGREWELRPHVEAEQATNDQAGTQSASPVTVACFGDHEQRNYMENNLGFLNEYEVTLCVLYSFRTVVKIHSYTLCSNLQYHMKILWVSYLQSHYSSAWTLM